MRSVVFFKSVDCCNVRMVQGCEKSGLAFKPCRRIRILSELYRTLGLEATIGSSEFSTSDKMCQINRSTQHMRQIVWQEFQTPASCVAAR